MDNIEIIELASLLATGDMSINYPNSPLNDMIDSRDATRTQWKFPYDKTYNKYYEKRYKELSNFQTTIEVPIKDKWVTSFINYISKDDIQGMFGLTNEALEKITDEQMKNIAEKIMYLHNNVEIFNKEILDICEYELRDLITDPSNIAKGIDQLNINFDKE